MSAPVAQSFACARCGGGVPLHGRASRVRCPRCGHDQDIPATKLVQVARYEGSAEAIAQRIETEAGARAQWERWYGKDGKARAGYLGSFAIFGAMIAVYAIGMGLRAAGVLDDVDLGRVLPLGMFGAFALGMGGYAAIAVRRGKQRAAVATPRVAAQCPKCGAPVAFAAGNASERCGHCGSPLVAGTTIMAQALDAARGDLRREAMARYRLERAAMANLYRASAASIMPYIVVGSFLPLTAGGALAFTVDLLTSDRSDATPVGLAVIWGLALANAGLLAGIVTWRRARKRRWAALAQAVAARLTGRVWTQSGEWVGWLNALWAGPYAVTSLLPGPCFHAVTGYLESFPVAVDADPVAADSRNGVPRFDVLVAARLPGDAEGVACPADVDARLRALGFGAGSCSGGFMAHGRAALPALKKSTPAVAADKATAVATILLDWARRVGARPPQAME